MFYIVYLIESKRNCILPVHWVDGNENQLEKFFNYGINNNQKYRCYFNNNRNIFDIQPNFDDFPIGNSNFPEEGCYVGKIIKFKRMFFYYFSTLSITLQLHLPSIIISTMQKTTMMLNNIWRNVV